MNETLASVTPIEISEEPSSVPTFQEFFESRWDRLFRALLLLTRNAQEAEDLTQEAFLKVLERWEAVEGFENKDGYLFRIALNSYRSLSRRALLAAKRVARASHAEDPFEAVAAHDEALRSLFRLTPRQRAAIVLTELRGFSYELAAEALGVKQSTVRVLVSQARARLSAPLEADDE